MSVLESRLHAELQRLGKEAADGSIKVAAGVPRGEANAVFDLAATLIDPDGPPDGQGGGIQPPTGIELRWTERFAGDYDMNGEANLGDIVPVVTFWGRSPHYDPPDRHGGFSTWPMGNPDDSNGGAAGGGATNWREARADGDGNGNVTLADIAPLALHFGEALSGYRVYRKGPGDTAYQLLPNPDDASSPLTIPRSKCFPAGHDAPDPSRPVRYRLTDVPQAPGLYEYCVVACLVRQEASTIEADTQSNHAPVGFQITVPDVTPPVWVLDTGIHYVGGANGYAFLDFGTAVDNAVPPGPASPPVRYNIYYSTQAPLDFANATKVTVDGPQWESPWLVGGQTYYFAVRAVDSASPPNEDANTKVLSVKMDWGATDTEPPVWVDTDINRLTIEGISEGRIGDQSITITHADAKDALCSPVHYDLYYVEDSDWSGYARVIDPATGALHPRAVVVRDIPKVYELHNRNRHVVSMLVRARDNANPPNETQNTTSRDFAAGRGVAQVIDPNLPGVTNAPSEPVTSLCTDDPANHKVYSVYYVGSAGKALGAPLRFLVLDLATGQWTTEVLDTLPAGQSISGLQYLAMSWKGELWLRYCTDEWRWMKCDLAGQWSEWADDPQHKFWDRLNFDHNGNPCHFSVYYEYGMQPGWVLEYHWWDPSSGNWVVERASDGGGYESTFMRPDGVFQVVCDGQEVATPWDPPDPQDMKARVVERSPAGVWTTVLEGTGPSGEEGRITPDHNFPCSTWDGGWGWAAACNISGSWELLAATPTGYVFLPGLLKDGHWAFGLDGSKYWPAQGGFDALPWDIYDTAAYFHQYSFGAGEFSSGIGHSQLIQTAAKVLHARCFDPLTGYEALVTDRVNCQLGTEELVLLTHPAGDTVYGDAN